MSVYEPGEERDLLAAEHALGLLEGGELGEAQRLAATERAFAELVAEWEERLAPLAEQVPAQQPDPQIWRRIEQALAVAAEPAASAPVDNVVQFRRKVTLWRGYAAGITAVAASLALVIAYQDSPEAPVIVQPERAPVLVAVLSSQETETSLSVAYDRQQASLLVTPGRLSGAAGHDHELWIIPSGGTPVSLGLIQAGAPQRLQITPQAAAYFEAQAGIALSVEPTGGSPTGQPTGPVVAAGELATV